MRLIQGTHELSDELSAQVTLMTSAKALDARTGPGPSLASFDLNVLVAFEALWVERSVTAAGRRLGLSQPATSAALARLREMLGDRLFVRGKSGLEPTDRCAYLAAPISKILVELRNALAGSSFDPATMASADPASARREPARRFVIEEGRSAVRMTGSAFFLRDFPVESRRVPRLLLARRLRSFVGHGSDV